MTILYILAGVCALFLIGAYTTWRILDYLKHKPKCGWVIKKRTIEAHWFFGIVLLEIVSDLELAIWVPTSYQLRLETYAKETNRWYRGWLEVDEADYDNCSPGEFYLPI